MNVRIVRLRRNRNCSATCGIRLNRLCTAALAGWIGLSLCAAAQAQEAPVAENPAPVPPGGSQQDYAPVNLFVPRALNQTRLSAGIDYSYVAPADVSFQNNKGDSQAQTLHLAVVGAVPVSERWFVPVGMSVGSVWLETVDGAPIPSRIDTARLQTGLGYWLNDQWSFTASLGPSFYRLEDIDSSDVGVAGMVGAVWRPQAGLTVSFGMGFNPDSDIPVLPAAGVRWDIRTNLTLNLMFPRPVLIYRVTEKLSVFGGGDFKFAVFRTDEDFGNSIGHPAFNNALGSYHDFHVGLGAEYQLQKHLSVSVEGGYSVGRQIHYKDLDQTVYFDPSPYGQVGLKYRF